LNAAGYILLWNRYGLSPDAAVYAAFYSSLLVVTFIDWDHQIIPNRITLPGIVIGLLSAATVLAGGFMDALLGAALGGGLLYAVAVGSEWVLKKEGMGLGDVKLLAMIGAFLGWKMVLVTLVLSSLSGAIIGVGLIALQRGNMKLALPFGTFLAAGAVAAMLVGAPLVDWYAGLLQ
jgi:leader peptidase (prepilin peptidase)/N-methyltransferase